VHGTTLLWIVVLLPACDGGPEERTGVRTDFSDAPAGVVDWDGRVVSLQLPGWSVEFCEGEGPFLCVERDGEPVGSVELLRTAVQQHATLADVLGRGGSERDALEAAAAEFMAVLSADRRTGLAGAYQLSYEPATAATVMGKQGLRVVVEGRVGDRIIERIVHYYAIQRDTSYLLAATGNERSGPLGEFSMDDLKAFEPLFGEIAAASRVGAGVL
jgi:hypothetical protein